MTADGPPCPRTPTKLAFRNRRDTLRAISQQMGRLNHGHAGNKLRPYACDACGQWHITSQPAR